MGALYVAVRDARNAIVSHAAASGYFDRVHAHEPKNSPGNGLSCFVWVGGLQPHRSGLNSTSVRVALNVQLRCPMLREPQDDIDLDLTRAADALMGAYTGDFDLGAAVQCIDLLGQAGPGMGFEAGYLNQDNVLYRVFDVTVPLLINDVWSQVA